MTNGIRIWAVAAAVLGQSFWAWGPVAAQQTVAKVQGSARSYVIVLAHRGCWNPAPEVSVSAIQHCKVVGADMVEIDVRESRDGVLVLMHDDRVDRTTDGTGAVSELTAAQIRALHLRTGAGGPGAAITAEHVPTLEEGLAAAKGKFLVNLHLKVPVEAKVAEVVKRMKMTGQVTTWVTAKPDDPQLLQSPLRGAIGIIPTINECGPKYPEPCFTVPIKSLEGYSTIQPPALFLDFRQSHAFIKSVSEAKRPAGSRIFVETLNDVDALPKEKRHAEWQALLDMGVTVFMTNEPGDLISFLSSVEYKARPSDTKPLLKPIGP